MRDLLNCGWNSAALLQGVAACLVMALVMYAPLAFYALRVRTRRS
jgi:hypothetical protein